MGGRGSGNYCRWGSTTTMEETKRIDIRYLKKQGWFNGYRSHGTLSWNCGDEPSGYINAEYDGDYMLLKYRYRENGGDWEGVELRVNLTTTSCNYGGSRKWFICPNIHCQRRVGVLSGHGKYFLCRHCYKLSYGSQNETRLDRMIRARNKLEDKIFDETGYQKKKGMHWKTFDKLYLKYRWLGMKIDEGVIFKLGHLI